MARFASLLRSSSLLATIAIAALGCGGGGGGAGPGDRGGTTGAGGRGGTGVAGSGGAGVAGAGGSAGGGVAGGGGAATGVGGSAGAAGSGGAAGNGSGGTGGVAGSDGAGGTSAVGAGGAAGIGGAGTGGVGGSAGAGGTGGVGGGAGNGAAGAGGGAGVGGAAGSSGGAAGATGGSAGAAGTGGGAGATGAGGSAGAGGGAGAAGAGDGGSGGAAGSGAAGAAGTGGGTGGAGTGGAAVAGTGGGAVAGTGGGAGTGGTGGTAVAGTGGGAGTGGTGGGGAGGGGGIGGAFGGFGGTGGMACQNTQIVFQPVAPTVYVLAERSGSMFSCLSSSGAVICPTPSDTAWVVLKEAVRAVVASVDAQVRLGFTTVWGTNPSAGGMCPSLQGTLTDDVAPAFANGTAIMTKYDSLPAPPNSVQVGVKFESPISSSVRAVGQALAAIDTPGEKYILLVTNGQSDYCDDSNALCATDSTVSRIQADKLAGITTIVLGIQSALFDQSAATLPAFANAGAGEPTIAALRTGEDLFAIYDQCSGVAAWHADLVASGKPIARGSTLGTYAATAGPSRAYGPNAADEAAIAARLKSCRFDLAGNLRVDTTRLSQAHIKIAGAEVPLDPTDGWSMSSDTQVVLNGAACTGWRTPGHDTIDFQFPCDVILE